MIKVNAFCITVKLVMSSLDFTYMHQTILHFYWNQFCRLNCADALQFTVTCKLAAMTARNTLPCTIFHINATRHECKHRGFLMSKLLMLTYNYFFVHLRPVNYSALTSHFAFVQQHVTEIC